MLFRSALNEHDLVRAHSSVGVLLGEKIGGQVGSRVCASPAVGVQLAGVIGGPDRRTRRVKSDKRTSPDDRCVDSWESSGEGGIWRRKHLTPRRSLFTPHKVANGPSVGAIVKKIRVTKGVYVRTGKEFEVIDDYTVGGNAHRLLQGVWTGTTEFRVAEDYIESVKEDKNEYEKQIEAFSKQFDPYFDKNGNIEVKPYSDKNVNFGAKKVVVWADCEVDADDDDFDHGLHDRDAAEGGQAAGAQDPLPAEAAPGRDIDSLVIKFDGRPSGVSARRRGFSRSCTRTVGCGFGRTESAGPHFLDGCTGRNGAVLYCSYGSVQPTPDPLRRRLWGRRRGGVFGYAGWNGYRYIRAGAFIGTDGSAYGEMLRRDQTPRWCLAQGETVGKQQRLRATSLGLAARRL